MIDPARVLQPLADAEPALRDLGDVAESDRRPDAVVEVWSAVEATLRILLRADARVPDDVRLAAPSPAETPATRVLEQLRAHDVIPMDLAGMAHELRLVAERVARGEHREGDAALARRTVDRLRDHVHAMSERPVLAAAHHAGAERALRGRVHTVPPPSAVGRGRGLAFVLLVAVAALALLVALLLGRRDDTMAQAVEAFEAGRLAAAEAGFREITARQPRNVTARLYLARIYRREDRPEEAAAALQEAVALAPDDAAVRRELGYLFLELDRPQAAAEQFRRAVTEEPDSPAAWVGWIRSLRAAGDPTAEDVLRRAPPEVRAAFPDP